MTVLESYIQQVAREINESDGIIDEAATKEGKYYDWSEDFVFTPEVISDLKKRDLLGIEDSGGIYVMIPVNREDAPEYWDRKYYKREDYEPYNILHISVVVNAKEKKIKIERWFGHRLDWYGENHTSTEKDWSDIPVLSKKTVQSLIDMYNENEVFDKLLDSIVKNTDAHEEYLDKFVGSEDKIKARAKQYNYDEEKVQKELERMFSSRKDRASIFSRWVENLIAITDGDYKSFEWDWDFPEIPPEDVVKDRYESHKNFADATNKSLEDYYATHSYTGD